MATKSVLLKEMPNNLDRSSAPLRDKKKLSYDLYPVNTIIGKLRRVLSDCKF
jgi:hypothetical protein